MICIVCPKGCRISCEKGAIEGYSCEKGLEYAKKELANPRRAVTSTVRVEGGIYPRVSVKTRESIPKGKVMEAVRALDGVTLVSPVKAGDTALENAAGTGVDFIVTKDM